MNNFCKLFESEQNGQVLVILDHGESMVEIRFDPCIEGIWTTGIKLESKDDDGEKLERIFAGITGETIDQYVNPVKQKLQQQFAEFYDSDDE